ncbi:hypothetical protein, partial [Candidatus Ichthyocystis sparus]|uniref:hypothetical protein n=1 Tax=Candidatus Ichthyocystis sparus TaxID=1561004 RepID=UPI00159EC17B
KGGGKSSSQKHGTSVAVSSSATTIGKEVGSGGIGGSFSAQKSTHLTDSEGALEESPNDNEEPNCESD